MKLMNNNYVLTYFQENVIECIIWPFSGDTKKLEEALIRTTVVDWTKVTCIDTVTSQVLDLLERIKSNIGFSYFHVGRVDTYFLDQSVAILNDVGWVFYCLSFFAKNMLF